MILFIVRIRMKFMEINEKEILMKEIGILSIRVKDMRNKLKFE